MIQQLDADVKTVVNEIPALKVGNLMVFQEGNKALDIIKANVNVFNSNEFSSAKDFSGAGTLEGNILKRSTTSVTIDVRAMLMDDGSLVIYRPPVHFLKLTVAKRNTKVAINAANDLAKGILNIDSFFTDLKDVPVKDQIETLDNNLATLPGRFEYKMVTPINAVEVFVIHAQQSYVKNQYVAGGLLELSPALIQGKNGRWLI